MKPVISQQTQLSKHVCIAIAGRGSELAGLFQLTVPVPMVLKSRSQPLLEAFDGTY